MHSQKENIEYMMTKESVAKLIIRQGVPAIVTVLITALFNLMDTFFIAPFGAEYVAGASVVFTLIALLQSLGYFIGLGAASMISMDLGRKDRKNATLIAETAIVFTIFFGILLLVLGVLFSSFFVTLFGATRESFSYARQYAVWVFLSAPFLLLTFVFSNLLRSVGKSQFGMYGLLAGFFVNLFLSLILVKWIPFKITGIGIVMLVSHMVSALFLGCLWIYSQCGTISVKIFLKKLFTRQKKYLLTKQFWKNVKCICIFGIPSLFRQGTGSIAVAMLNHIAGGISKEVVAAMSVAGKVFLVMFSVAIGLSQGYQPVAGYQYGAGSFKRLKKATWFSIWLGTIVMSVLGVLTYIYADRLLFLFQAKGQELKLGITALRYQSLAMPFLTFANITNMMYQAMKKPVQASIIAALRQGICYIPLLYILPKMFDVHGLLLAQPAADVITFFVCMPFFTNIIKKGNTSEK